MRKGLPMHRQSRSMLKPRLFRTQFRGVGDLGPSCTGWQHFIPNIWCYQPEKSADPIIRFAFLLTDESLTSLAKKVPDLLDYTGANGIIDYNGDVNAQLYKLLGIDDRNQQHIKNHSHKNEIFVVHKMYLDFISSNFMTNLSVSTMKCGHRKVSHGYTV